MASAAKSQKDKPHPTRLTPRPTAASAARAARNAMNRNITAAPTKVSPSRSRAALSPSPKQKSPRQQPKVSKSDAKIDRQPEVEVLVDNHEEAKESTESVLHAPETYDISEKISKHQEIEESTIASTENDPEKSETYTDNTFDIKNSEIDLQQESPDISDNPQSQSNDIFDMHHDDSENIQNEETSDKNVSFEPSPRPKSYCGSPMMSSCPPTPRSRSSTPSRPTTPAHPSAVRTPNRPRTPSTTNQCKTPSSSRPSTPQKPLQPQAPKSQAPQSAIPIATTGARNQPQTMVCPPVKEEEDIKSMFATKNRQFQRMKKELDIKQQEVLDVFNNLRNLNEHLVKEGVGSGEGLQCQELVVFNVGDWTSDEVTQLCRDAVAASSNAENAIDFIENLKHIDESSFGELDSQVAQIPSKFADLCLRAFMARQELIDWVKELIEPMQEDGRGESLERIAHYNKQGLELCETLRELKVHADETVDTVAQISKCAIRERSVLLTVGESLVREIARLQKDLEARAVIVNEMREIRAENDTAKALQEARNQLEEERTARVATKEKLAMTEAQLRQTRIRVSKMDRQLREAEASIVSLTASVKTLEDQSRQREVHLEARARKLKESLKTGEVAHGQIAQQRDALQAEVQSLNEQLKALTALNKTNVQDLSKEIKELKSALENQRQETEKQIETNKILEKNLAESQITIEELKSKIPDPNENIDLPTEREIDLWAELQATKETLRMTEDEVTACKREKVRFLETLTKISDSENKIGMQQKLAAELLSKEEIVAKMLIQIRELTKNIKLNEQKVIQYEQYVRDLQAHKRAAANCHETPNGISYQDLQQEIMNLKMSLLDAVHRNEELTELLSQKDQQLEQQDKTSRAQARIIKVREELINMLKNKETEQSRELSALQQDLEYRMKVVDEVNKQIAAKAEEIQELFATLENKQQQIHRLEKIVLALEEQQRRAQAQRMRHEEKIAALEHELAATNRRERKFLFF